ncbi:hypothetical protein Q31b_06020 [Novipirellula aureliae]|uniref:GxxExxY protein n=1 Tax=Novipirellula aureliae TaxID=2527966 RepID=A0A5C6E9J9_9BACT|nr:GxxExxY protein [Novipirellula aureliae]TWU45430.1 hypothetical protein Q31b_06020 [Novipirellula aureliae]
MPEQQSPFAQEGYDFMAAAFEVHNVLGGGLLEEIYQESLEIELELRGIMFRRKQELEIHYKQRKLKKRYVPDLCVFEKVVVELKATSEIGSEHEAQLINYMRISRSSVGYLVNFGPIKKLEYKRFILSEFL